MDLSAREAWTAHRPVLWLAIVLEGTLVQGRLESAHFIENLQEATAKGRQYVLHSNRGFLAEDGALHDAEPSHLAQPLVHDLGREPRATSKQRGWSTASLGEKPQQPD